MFSVYCTFYARSEDYICGHIFNLKLMGGPTAVGEAVTMSESLPKNEPRPKGISNRVLFDQSQGPKPINFNVMIQPVPLWKMGTVANFKRRAHFQKIQDQLRRDAMKKNADADANGSDVGGSDAIIAVHGSIGGGQTSGVGRRSTVTRKMVSEAAGANSINASEQRSGNDGCNSNNNLNSRNSGDDGENTPIDNFLPPEDYEIGAGLPNPMLGLSIANKSMLRSLSNDELKTEIDKMNFNCSLIKNELRALESFRVNLLWLLRNSTMYEVQRNHNVGGLKAGSLGTPKKRYRSTNDNASSLPKIPKQMQ